jgi:hypothetical protein
VLKGLSRHLRKLPRDHVRTLNVLRHRAFEQVARQAVGLAVLALLEQ